MVDCFIGDDISESSSDAPNIQENKNRNNQENNKGEPSSKGNLFRELENMSGSMFLDLPQAL